MKEDSRLKGFSVSVTHPTMPYERTYCVSCGAPKGWVTVECYDFIRCSNIIVICDVCEEKYATMGGLPLEKAPIQEISVGELK